MIDIVLTRKRRGLHYSKQGAQEFAVIHHARGLLLPRVPTALLLGMLWCGALALFALTHSYALSLAALFGAGFLELSFGAMAQALVQLNAPAALRGHVIGVFVMAALGLRFVSGFTVGLLGAVIGVHASLALSAAMLFAVIALLFAWQALRPGAPASGQGRQAR